MNGSRKARKGNFSKARLGPDSTQKQGLNWDAVRDRYVERMRDQIERGVDDLETQVWRDNHLLDMSPEERRKFFEARAQRATGTRPPRATSLTAESRAKGGRKGRGPRVDVDQIVRHYEEDKFMPSDIAKHMGITTETVIVHLKKRNIYDPNRFKHSFNANAASEAARRRWGS